VADDFGDAVLASEVTITLLNLLDDPFQGWLLALETA
jgi:hypothetical protein